MNGQPATLSFPPGHPVFAGHFPETPIVPGALLLDAALLAISKVRGEACAACAAGRAAGRDRVAAVKFFRPVAPGEILSLSLTHSEDGSVLFAWRAGTECVASGTVAPPESAHSGHS